jgi:hypothetical protein
VPARWSARRSVTRSGRHGDSHLAHRRFAPAGGLFPGRGPAPHLDTDTSGNARKSLQTVRKRRIPTEGHPGDCQERNVANIGGIPRLLRHCAHRKSTGVKSTTLRLRRPLRAIARAKTAQRQAGAAAALSQSPAISGVQNVTKKPSEQVDRAPAEAAARSRQVSQTARDSYITYPGHLRACETKEFEVLTAIRGVEFGRSGVVQWVLGTGQWRPYCNLFSQCYLQAFSPIVR